MKTKKRTLSIKKTLDLLNNNIEKLKTIHVFIYFKLKYDACNHT